MQLGQPLPRFSNPLRRAQLQPGLHSLQCLALQGAGLPDLRGLYTVQHHHSAQLADRAHGGQVSRNERVCEDPISHDCVIVGFHFNASSTQPPFASHLPLHPSSIIHNPTTTATTACKRTPWPRAATSRHVQGPTILVSSLNRDRNLSAYTVASSYNLSPLNSNYTSNTKQALSVLEIEAMLPRRILQDQRFFPRYASVPFFDDVYLRLLSACAHAPLLTSRCPPSPLTPPPTIPKTTKQTYTTGGFNSSAPNALLATPPSPPTLSPSSGAGACGRSTRRSRPASGGSRGRSTGSGRRYVCLHACKCMYVCTFMHACRHMHS